MCSDHALLKQAAELNRVQMQREQVPEFEALFERFVEEESEVIRETLDSNRDLRVLVAGFYEDQRNTVRREAEPIVRDYGSRIANEALQEMGAADAPVEPENFADPYSRGLTARWVGSSVKQLRQIERDNEGDAIQEATEQRLAEWEEQRATLSAQREATQANGAFAKHAFLLGGATKLVWRAVGDSCPLCTKMDGRVVGVTGTFLGEGDELEAGSGDEARKLVSSKSIGHPPLHGMGGGAGVCDCIVTTR